MNGVQVRVNPGVCGFKTVIRAAPREKRQASIEFRTDCPNLKPLESELTSADAYQACFSKVGKSVIYETASKYCKHAACPVPMAITKAIEAACGLALPRNVSIEVVREEDAGS